MYSPPTRSVVLHRELGRPLVTSAAKIPINVRTTTEANGPQIRALICELAGSERSTRRRFHELRIGTCHRCRRRARAGLRHAMARRAASISRARHHGVCDGADGYAIRGV
jgi:hypothetical protein